MDQIIRSVKASLRFLPLEPGHQREFNSVFLKQVFFTFVQAIPFTAGIGLIIGGIFSFQNQFGLANWFQGEQFGQLLVFVIFREVAPLVTALLLVSRSSTAIAAEMATSKVQREVEALQIMGIDIFHYLIAPRIVAGAVSLFCMAVTFLLFALLGSYIGLAWELNISLEKFIIVNCRAILPIDLAFFLLKTTIPGALAAWIACKTGLSLKNAPFEVPIVTKKAVIWALRSVVLVHIVLSLIFYLTKAL